MCHMFCACISILMKHSKKRLQILQLKINTDFQASQTRQKCRLLKQRMWNSKDFRPGWISGVLLTTKQSGSSYG